MTQELELYYSNRFAMFASQGWKDFISDIERMKKTANTVDDVTVKTLERRQGEIAMMNYILQIEELSKKGYEEINADI